MLIDSHCHLDFEALANDIDGVLARAAAAGVTGMVTISTHVEKFSTYTALAERYANVWCSVGTHPHHADQELHIQTDDLVRLSAHPRCVAIGEAGLDYFYDNAPREAFAYCFETPSGSDYPPILNAHEIAAGQVIVVDGPGGTISVTAFEQTHGSITSLGFRIGNFAYSCDLSGFPEASFAAISGLDLWIIDALRPTPHPSHLSLPETLEWIARFAPRQAVLTNMHIDLDYRRTEAETPDNVTPAFDGMQIDVLSGRILNR